MFIYCFIAGMQEFMLPLHRNKAAPNSIAPCVTHVKTKRESLYELVTFFPFHYYYYYY